MTIAGLMQKSKYSSNIIRTGDDYGKTPYTILYSEMGTIIKLPLPTNLSSNMGADWQQEQVNAVKFQLMHNKQLTQNLLGSTSFSDAYNTLGDAGKEAYRKGSEEFSSLLSRLKESNSKLGGIKHSPNPRNEMLFNGMQFKSYSFNFLLVPYKKKDSDNIQKAIKEIQLASAPALKGSKMFMEYPDTWNIKFMSGNKEGNKYLMKINECCCTNIGVNYTPQNDSSSLHEENAPLAVELTLDFTEVIMPTKETIKEEYYG